MYTYQYLPEYAAFILQQHLESYAQETIRLGYEVHIPLIKYLSQQFTSEQLLQISISTSKEFLTYLAQNKAYEQIATSLEKWMHDELHVVRKFQINAQDITLINYIREQVLKKWIPDYTTDVQQALHITSEIDRFVLGSVTSSTDAYMDMLKQQIEEGTDLSSKIIEASPAITFIYDLTQQKEPFISNKVKEVMGYEPESLTRMKVDNIAQLAHPDDLPLLKDYFQSALKDHTHATHQIEYRFRHADGTYRWLRTYQVVLKRDKDGNPAELLGKTFEITHEKETALALAKSEQRLLEAQSLAHIGSFEWNIKENTSSNTAEVFTIFEFNADQNFEQFMEHVHTADRPKVKAALADSFKTGHYESEYRYLKNGKEKVIWSLGKVAFEEGQAVRMVGTVQDITEIKRMEMELRNKTTALERSNESLQHFASVASHDLKEPLRKINMFVEMVVSTENSRLSPTSENFLKKTQEASRRMQQMIEDILAFSTLTDADDKEWVSLQSLLDETLDLLEPVIQEKAAHIQTDHLPEAMVSPSQFKQLFQNLISNSLKFSKADETPRIAVSHALLSPNDMANDNLKPADQYLQISIADNGIGFEEEHAEKIFGLFSRLHGKNKYAGTGLGLAICKRIAENHDGLITAHSQPGIGATFDIVIPHMAR